MDVTNTIMIDLEPFGFKGTLEMAPPSLRKSAYLKNQIAKYTKLDPTTGKITDTCVGDIEVLSVLAYVKSAPFGLDLDEFYDFCDQLEASKVGSSLDMFKAMSEATKDIDGGKTSPLERLEAQAIRSSE